MDKVILEEKTVYGVNRLYVQDENLAQAFQTLTGKKTIDRHDIDALKLLGVQFELAQKKLEL